jgi:hypothetical protein
MGSDDGEAMGRDAPFPREMQGRWVEESEPSMEVFVEGSGITWRGVPMDYQARRLIACADGTLAVEMDFAERSGFRDWLMLIAWPSGDMHAYNDNMVARFVRPTS